MNMEVQILINGLENDGSEVSENITDIEEAIEYLQQLLDRNPAWKNILKIIADLFGGTK